jgi:hypothetical protein
MRRIIAMLAVAMFAGACGASTGVLPSPSPAASPITTPTQTPSPSPSPSPLPTPSPTAPAGFACTSTSGGAVAASAVTAARVGQHPGYDRFVIEFGAGVPSYSVTIQSKPIFVRAPKGDTVTLDGTSGVRIVVHSVTNWMSYAGPTAFHPGYPYLRQAMQTENFEGYQQWALGVRGSACLRVFTLGSPSRLVVDVVGI